jgi:hypothetical protein
LLVMAGLVIVDVANVAYWHVSDVALLAPKVRWSSDG